MHLYLSEAAPWYALVGRAQAVSGILLDGELEAYLVSILLRARAAAESSQPEAVPDEPAARLQALAEQYLLSNGLLPHAAGPHGDRLVLAGECYRQLIRMEQGDWFARVAEGLDDLAGVIEGMRWLSEKDRSAPLPGNTGPECVRPEFSRLVPPPASPLPAGARCH